MLSQQFDSKQANKIIHALKLGKEMKLSFTYSKIKITDSAQPRKHSIVTRPFPRERVGSGDKTRLDYTFYLNTTHHCALSLFAQQLAQTRLTVHALNYWLLTPTGAHPARAS